MLVFAFFFLGPQEHVSSCNFFNWGVFFNLIFHFCSIIFPFIGTFIILILIFALYSPQVLSHYFPPFSWLFTFVFSTGLLSVGWPFSFVSEDGVGDMSFDSVLLNPPQLMMHLVGIPPGFSKNFSYCLVPKAHFHIFVSLRIFYKEVKRKFLRLPSPGRISHHVNLEVQTQ